MTRTMKVFGIKNYMQVGDLSALRQFEVPNPTATGHDILVQVKAVATNPIDYKALGNLGKGEGPVDGEAPLVVGWDASGIVTQVGPETSFFKVGDEVMFAGDFFRAGAFGEQVLVDERIVGRKPSNVTWGQAASLPLTNLTAYESFTDQLKITKADAGKTILINGGGGGVATAAIEMAKKVFGLKVVATGSRNESIQYVKKLGADHVINHHKPLGPQLEDIGIKNVDYVLDTYGLSPELFTEFTEVVKPFGGICSIWPAASVDLMQLFWKSINFSALLMFTRPTLENDQRVKQHKALEKIAGLIEDGTLTCKESSNLPLTTENLAQALEAQHAGKTIGKRTLTFV